jgi:hypothetical protein
VSAVPSWILPIRAGVLQYLAIKWRLSQT